MHGGLTRPPVLTDRWWDRFWYFLMISLCCLFFGAGGGYRPLPLCGCGPLVGLILQMACSSGLVGAIVLSHSVAVGPWCALCCTILWFFIGKRGPPWFGCSGGLNPPPRKQNRRGGVERGREGVAGWGEDPSPPAPFLGGEGGRDSSCGCVGLIQTRRGSSIT